MHVVGLDPGTWLQVRENSTQLVSCEETSRKLVIALCPNVGMDTGQPSL